METDPKDPPFPHIRKLAAGYEHWPESMEAAVARIAQLEAAIRRASDGGNAANDGYERCPWCPASGGAPHLPGCIVLTLLEEPR